MPDYAYDVNTILWAVAIVMVWLAFMDWLGDWWK